MRKYLLSFLLCFAGAFGVRGQDGQPPNIIVILTDDLGWSSLSSAMDASVKEALSNYHETPNMDKLGREGMRFSRGYAPASICSPSRRSILFGQTPLRQGDEEFRERYGPGHTRQLSVPQALKAVNPRYRTAHYGKWDIRADIFPEDVGYDESDGNTGNGNGNLMTKKDDKWADHFVTDDPKRIATLTGRALNFISRQVKAGRPFYLQVSHYATHVGMESRQETYDKYAAKKKGEKHHNPAFAAMLEDLDGSVGQVMELVDGLGIGGNTYIFLMADNGAVEFLPPTKKRLDHPSEFEAPMRNYPLRGGKWTLYEGGIRVPFMVKGPGIKAGSQCDIPVAGWDLLPTFLELAGGRPSAGQDLDGRSFAGILRNGGTVSGPWPARDLFFHRYHPSYPHSAIISGQFKLLHFWKTGKTELYDLAGDRGELKDIAAAHPGKVRELSAKLMAYMKEVNPGLARLYQ